MKELKPLYTKITDFSDALVSDNLHGYPPNNEYNVNARINDFALTFIIKDSLKDQLKSVVRNGYDMIDCSLIENDAIRKTMNFHNNLFEKQSGNRRFFMDSSFKNIKNTCSLFYDIFSNPGFSTLDKVKALGAIHHIGSSRTTYDNRLSPFTSYSPAINKIEKIPLSLSSFKGTELLITKQTPYTDLTHALVPLVLLEDKINEIEEGLFNKLESTIDRLFSADTFGSFYKEAMLYLGYIEPYLHESSLAEKELIEDEFGDPMPKNSQKTNDTLLTKYKLECHCGSDTSIWKVRAIPVIIELTFNMRVL